MIANREYYSRRDAPKKNGIEPVFALQENQIKRYDSLR